MKITVRREQLLDEAVLAFTVDAPSKPWIVSKCDSGGTLKEFCQFHSPLTLQVIDGQTIGVTGEPFRELANRDFTKALTIDVSFGSRKYPD